MASKRYLSILNLALAVALIAAAALLGRDLYRNLIVSKEVTEVIPPHMEEMKSPTPPKTEYEVIVTRNLWAEKFEAPEEKPEPTPPPPRQPPPRLRLMGTSVSSDSARNRAFIEDLARRTQDIYKLGDLVSGARILKIETNRVVLDNQGEEFEIIAFPQSLPVR